MRSFLFLLCLFLLCGCSAIPLSGESALHSSAPPPVFQVSTEESSVPDESALPEVPPYAPLLDVPLLCQYPALPTGCEAVAATMVLQYYGLEISPETFAADYLPCSTDFYSYGGKDYGPDPNASFAGDPFSAYAYGCFAPVIATAVKNTPFRLSAECITGLTLEALCETYVANGAPVLIWATTGMREVKAGNAWYLPNGTLFTWPSGEHCYVLIGESEDFFFFADPQTGNAVGYRKDVSQLRFQSLGSNAVYIHP